MFRLFLAALIATLCLAAPARADRIKDLGGFQGIRSNQLSIESGSSRWSVTLTSLNPYGEEATTGRINLLVGASENPPFSVPDHCIGVRIASRSASSSSSPMPISSPYRITGVPGIVNWRL